MFAAVPFLVWVVAAPRPDVAWCDARMRQMAGVAEIEQFEPARVVARPAAPTLDDPEADAAELSDAAVVDLLRFYADAGDAEIITAIGPLPPRAGLILADDAVAHGFFQTAWLMLNVLLAEHPEHPDAGRWAIYQAQLTMLVWGPERGLDWLVQRSAPWIDRTDEAQRMEVGRLAGWAAAEMWTRARWTDTPEDRDAAVLAARVAVDLAPWLPLDHPARVCPPHLR
ncbi:MAG: hypothetical protein H6739_37550 [Alphaproteobacteria bacterium]|nr:hypothetical protein [Alphaproteobacteria bacterium]